MMSRHHAIDWTGFLLRYVFGGGMFALICWYMCFAKVPRGTDDEPPPEHLWDGDGDPPPGYEAADAPAEEE
jgi:hypothetical protein